MAIKKKQLVEREASENDHLLFLRRAIKNDQKEAEEDCQILLQLLRALKHTHTRTDSSLFFPLLCPFGGF